MIRELSLVANVFPRLVRFTNGMFYCPRHIQASHSSLALVHIAYRLHPLEPFDLISSVRLNGDRFGRRDDESDGRAERIVLFSTKPGLRVQFLPLPKAGHVDVDDNHPQVAADIFTGEKEGKDGHGHQTSADNKTSHRPDQHGKKKERSLVQTLAKDESVSLVPSPIR